MNDIKPAQQIAALLRENNDFLVASHVNPDGDALGALAALGFILRDMGKRYRLFNASGPPAQFDWLRLPDQLYRDESVFYNFDPSYVIFLDCGSAHRVGELLQSHPETARVINIDHHPDNPGYGELNWIDPAKASVGEMIALLARELDQPLSGPMGEALYLAMVEDTGSFSFANTSPLTLELAAEILRQGLDVGEFTNKHENQWSLNRLELWTAVLGRARFYCDSRVGVLNIDASTLERVGATKEDCDGLVNIIRRVKDVRVAVSLREKDANSIKFSLRAKGDVDVSDIASDFGGGGHKNASGGTIEGDMQKAERLMLRAIQRRLAFPCDNPEPKSLATCERSVARGIRTQ